MAFLRVKTRGFDRVIAVPGKAAERAKAMPSRYRFETSAKLSVIHQHGGRQTVSGRMQRALAVKIGPGGSPPRVGTVLRHPSRPVRADQRMAKDSATHLARHVLHGTERSIQPIMRHGTRQQFSRGGVPGWRQARAWGLIRPGSPTLGGPSSRVASGWLQRGRYVERR